jgi:hypothetical protein
MARRSSLRKITYFEPIPPHLARNTIIESTFDVGQAPSSWPRAGLVGAELVG